MLREYREYERSMTTLVDAAVKPRVSRYLTAIAAGLRALADTGLARPDGMPLHVMKSNGGVARGRGGHQPITTVLAGRPRARSARR